MNCYYCKQPIEEGMPWLPIAVEWMRASEPLYDRADLACAIVNNRIIPATSDKSGKYCDYHHPPTGRFCMLPPHGDRVAHELEAKR